MNRRSRFTYSTAGDWTTGASARPWRREMPTVGGARKSATGVPASQVVYEGHVLLLTLRLRESEWPMLVAMVRWGQSSGVIRWYPDAAAGVFYEVYLEAPLAGQPLKDEADEYPGYVQVQIAIRRVSNEVWDVRYFQRVGE
jgi:hypothetical protein